ncbi:MAG: NUMOD3 domain-containing DNA-binding protein [Candidatus Thorarchaeota archaeon]
MSRNVKKYHKIWNDHHLDDPIIKGDGYDIHHKDFDHGNDDPDNLQKMSHSEHAKLHQKGKIISEETKRKMSNNHADFKKENNPMYKYIFSKEQIKRKSELVKGEKNPMYGRKLSKEHKNKISEKIKGENHPNCKLTQMTANWIRDILDSKEYKEAKSKGLISQKQLADLFGVNECAISGIKNNKTWKVENDDANIR